MKNHACCLVLILALVAAAAGRAFSAERERPKLAVVNAGKERPKIDGVLDEAVWKRAAATMEFRRPDGGEPLAKTRLLLARDADTLYVAVEAFEDAESLAALSAKVRVHDGDGIWNDDAIEIYVDPADERFSHYQIIVNSRGTTWDAYFPAPHYQAGDMKWNPAYEAAVKVGKTGWTAELALPLEAFSWTDEFSSDWGFNVLRHRAKANEYACWSPLREKGPHDPSTFGKLTGMPAGVNRSRFKLAPDAPKPVVGKKDRPQLMPAIIGNGGKPPKIDGLLDEVAWKGAAAATEFAHADGAKPGAKTRLLVARDDTKLYVAVECFEDPKSLALLKAEVAEHDGPVWTDDSVELFIDPAGKRSTYYHIIANTRGTTYDAFYPFVRQGDTTWEPKYECAVKVGKEGWTAEFALPLTMFTRTEHFASEWAFNALRARRVGDGEYSYWSPVGAVGDDAHSPSEFGTLIGMPAGKNAHYDTGGRR